MSRYLCLILPAALLIAASVRGQDDLDAIAGQVDEQTVAVARLNVEQLEVPALMKLVTSSIPAAAANTEDTRRKVAEATRNAQELREAFLKSASGKLYAVVSIADLPAPPFLVAPVKEGGDAAALAELIKEATRQKSSHLFGRNLVVGSEATIQRLKELAPADRPDLAKALAAAGDATLAVALSPSDDNRRVLREMLPRLPEKLGGGSGGALADGVQWAVMSASAPPRLSLSATIQSRDAASAVEMQKLIERTLALLGDSEAARREIPQLEALLQLLTPQVKGDRIELALTAENGGSQKLVAALAVPLQRMRQEAGRMQSMNNLRQLALGMHNYHDVHRQFPPRASRSKDGKPMLSWRVHLLPFVEQADLYNQFHLDEPWDSEHNRKLVEKMPKVFASPNLRPEQIAKGLTSYVGPYTAAAKNEGKDDKGDQKPERMIFDVPEGAKLPQIVDGTSNTIMILEAHQDHAVVWTKPDDVAIDFDNPLAALKGQPNGGFSAVLGDGSVRFIRDTVDAKLLRLALLMNDRQAFGPF